MFQLPILNITLVDLHFEPVLEVLDIFEDHWFSTCVSVTPLDICQSMSGQFSHKIFVFLTRRQDSSRCVSGDKTRYFEPKLNVFSNYNQVTFVAKSNQNTRTVLSQDFTENWT